MLLPLFAALATAALAGDNAASNAGDASANGGGGGAGEDGGSARVLGAQVAPVAMAQVWVTAYDMDSDEQADSTGYGDPEDDPGLKFKRLRLGLAGAGKRWDYAFVVGNDAPYDGLSDHEEDVQVLDAFVTAQPTKGFDVRLGKQKVPFSRDQMMAASELTFQERGIGSEHIAPERDLGLTLAYGRKGGKFTAGVFNAGGDLFGDEAAGKTFVGRLEWAAGKANTYQTWGDKKEFGFGVGAGGYYTMGVATSQWAAGGDAMLRVHGLSILADGAFSHLAPTNTDIASSEVFAETDRWGVTTQIGYQIKSIEPAVRFSMFNDSALGSYTQVLAGGEWHTGEDHIRVGAGYELRLEGQDPYDNDTARLWAQFRL
jgi:hypothetical protein